MKLLSFGSVDGAAAVLLLWAVTLAMLGDGNGRLAVKTTETPGEATSPPGWRESWFLTPKTPRCWGWIQETASFDLGRERLGEADRLAALESRSTSPTVSTPKGGHHPVNLEPVQQAYPG
jgi:hypothetical protein